ncbi:hypothetical protein FBY04_13331 [Pseudomonas sp. SJZ080]|uniref:hypothetical protein n=1 Tax=Pseudomonas sp. SJZ080 TaxID=2572888 RepID=UPI00119AAFAE|nr:hypothetical protein [Pseudomonas sp. SJZ080]TWC46129.1 hypothetical protein FBY04_13331 [Pseudomonas sp. SJZ080]
MLGRIGKGLNCFSPANDNSFNRFVLTKKIQDEILPYVSKVTICDRPSTNHSGLTQYNYDDNRDGIRQRRVSVARQFDLTLSDAPFDRRFVIELAKEVEKTHQMPGQCAEMASITAVKLKDIAAQTGLFVYTLQLPDYNHTITLLSETPYRSNEWINWAKEFNSTSIIVDLWQGALSQNKPDALVSPANKNTYTRTSPRAIVQCKVWGGFPSRHMV